MALIAGIGATDHDDAGQFRGVGASQIDRWGLVLVSALDVQLLLGLLLYLVVSPTMARFAPISAGL